MLLQKLDTVRQTLRLGTTRRDSCLAQRTTATITNIAYKITSCRVTYATTIIVVVITAIVVTNTCT